MDNETTKSRGESYVEVRYEYTPQLAEILTHLTQRVTVVHLHFRMRLRVPQVRISYYSLESVVQTSCVDWCLDQLTDAVVPDPVFLGSLVTQ